MDNLDVKILSNSEIKIKILNYENEYETIKNKINTLLNRMKELDKLYLECENELKKRNISK